MSANRPVPARKLPPLNPEKDGYDDASARSVDRKPRKKKKPVAEGSDSEGGAQRRARSSSRTRESTENGGMGKRKVQKTRFDDSQASVRMSPGTEAGSTADVKEGIKKKAKRGVGTSRETLMGASEDTEGEASVSSGKVGKKKKKKQKTSNIRGDDAPVGLAAEIADLDDDIIEDDPGEMPNESKMAGSQLWAPGLHSQVVNKVFIEKQSGFKGMDMEKLAKTRMEQQLRAMAAEPVPVTKTTIQFGLATHRVLRTFSVFCHGLLAGFALWHIITVFVISNYNEKFLTLLNVYYPLALPVQSLYQLLFVICTVSALDRYDVARTNRRFWLRTFTLQNGAVSIFIYFVGYIFSLAIANMDDKISLYDDQPQLWAVEETRDSELSAWRIHNLIRGICAILGWFVISIRPNTDRLSKNLQRADENLLGEVEKDQHALETVRSNGVI